MVFPAIERIFKGCLLALLDFGELFYLSIKFFYLNIRFNVTVGEKIRFWLGLRLETVP